MAGLFCIINCHEQSCTPNSSYGTQYRNPHTIMFLFLIYAKSVFYCFSLANCSPSPLQSTVADIATSFIYIHLISIGYGKFNKSTQLPDHIMSYQCMNHSVSFT